MTLCLNPDLDPDRMRATFLRHGRIHIQDVLKEASAQALHGLMVRERLWMCSTIGGGTVADVPVEMLDAMTPAQSAQFIALAHGEARDGFHYMFDSLRVTDPIEKGETPPGAYMPLFDFLNGPEFLGFIRALTGDLRPIYADSQATRFLPGHYLTRHDDQKSTASRLYAYVLNLTPRWRPDWGGLLNFYDEDDHVSEAFTPKWNALNLFRVPQAHAVSFVAPFAGAARLSITGWVRDDLPTAVADFKKARV